MPRYLWQFRSYWSMCSSCRDTQDTFVPRLTADQRYSVSSAYGVMFFVSSTPLGTKQIWKTQALLRVRFFFWLVMHDRCWTAEWRCRHGLQDSDTCVICDLASETMDHILLGCVFCREVWAILLRKLRNRNLIHKQVH